MCLICQGNYDQEAKFICICKSVIELPILKNLEILECINIKTFPEITSVNLKELIINSLFFQAIPSFPETLQILDISYSNNYINDNITLFKLPKFLKTFKCAWTDIPELPELPDSLIELNIDGCRRINVIPKLPINLKYLYCSFCWFSKFPVFPKTLEILKCNYCISIFSLTELPDNLRILECDLCKNLTKISNLPEKLQYLSCNDCTNLKTIAKIPENVIELCLENCNVIINDIPDKTETFISPISLPKICIEECLNPYFVTVPNNDIDMFDEEENFCE